MIIIKNKYIPFGRFDYMSWWPILFVKKEINPIDLNHERIHMIQQRECFVVMLLLLLFVGVKWYLLPLSYFTFYIIYIVNWAVEVVKMWFGGDKKCYKDLLFEVEAYNCEEYSKYLSVRKPFAWLYNQRHTN